jgi:hypothetical protein
MFQPLSIFEGLAVILVLELIELEVELVQQDLFSVVGWKLVELQVSAME